MDISPLCAFHDYLRRKMKNEKDEDDSNELHDVTRVNNCLFVIEK